MDCNKPLFFTVVSKLLLKIKQTFSSLIVQFYDSRITKKNLYIILSYNSEVSDGFSHEASSDSDYIPMDCTPNRKGCTVIARAMTKNLQVLAKQVDKVIAVEEGIVVEVVVEEGVVYK